MIIIDEMAIMIDCKLDRDLHFVGFISTIIANEIIGLLTVKSSLFVHNSNVTFIPCKLVNTFLIINQIDYCFDKLYWMDNAWDHENVYYQLAIISTNNINMAINNIYL